MSNGFINNKVKDVAKYFLVQHPKPKNQNFGMVIYYGLHQMMKSKLDVPDGRPLADFLPILTIKAKDFASELTSHNVIEKGKIES